MPAPLNIVFAGTPDFAVPALQALLDSPHRVPAVYTQPDRPAGRGRKLRASPVKELARQHGVPVHQPLTLKEAAVQQTLAGLQPDLMVVVAYGLILPRSVLEIPRHGCLNIHASLLPRWRGAAPIQRAILNGDSETGVSIMQMDAGLDTGDVLKVMRQPITPETTSASLHDSLADLGARALLATLDDLQAGTLAPSPQDETRATYAAKLGKDEADIDWRRPAAELARQVMAFNPWPVAQTRLDGQPLRIWRALALEQDGAAAPGTVIASRPEGLDVACGRGVLRLLELQLPGKKTLPVADFVNARKLDGLRLGDPE